MKRLRRNPDESDPETNPDPDGEGSFSKDQHERKCGLSSMKMMGFFVVALMIVSVVFSVSVVLQDPPSDGVLESGKNVRFLDVMESNKEEQVLEVQPQKGNSIFVFFFFGGGGLFLLNETPEIDFICYVCFNF